LFIIIIVILDAGYKMQAKKSGTTTTIDKRKDSSQRSKRKRQKIVRINGIGRIFSRQDKIKSENRSRKTIVLGNIVPRKIGNLGEDRSWKIRMNVNESLDVMNRI